jgi:Ca2+-binding RTX toxin-like protein
VRQRTSGGRRLKWGLGVMSAVLVGVGAPVAAQTAERAPSPAQDEQPDPQSGQPDESFSGYVGYAGANGAAAAAAPTDSDDPKPEPFGSVGSNSAHAEDVPGQAGSAEAPAESGSTPIPLPPEPSPRQTAAVESAITESGSARVIVMMRTPIKVEASLTEAQVADQHADIQDSLAQLDTILAGTSSEVLTKFEVVPSAVVTVDQAGLDALTANPNVAAITLDREFPADLDVSTGIIDSDLLNAAGVHGNNFEGSTGGPFEVAILDSGVDNQHSAFTGRIVAQACFSATSQCPNGGTTQIGGAAGDNCTYSGECDHGTHVGGIAAGAVYAGGHEGVADGAGIVAVQIGHSSTSCQSGEPNPCWRYFFSDLDLALQHTLSLRNGGRNIAAVNMSLGGPLYSPGGPCATDFPTTNAVTTNLNAAGVGVIAAAGNDGSSTQVGHLACLPNVFAVGATDDFDSPAFFTNSSSQLNWWAPGVGIRSAITTGPTATGPKSGTSMATPHVVGAFAALRECIPNTTPGAVAATLNATGVNVTRNGVTRRRINVLEAATSTVNNNDFASPETLAGDGPFDDFDWNVCADREAGEPGVQSVEDSMWWTWTPATTGTATISTQDGGGNATTFDTTLQVYTGSTLGTLSTIAFNDDVSPPSDLRSRVVFPVNAGTTYRIQVDGFNGQNGLLNLHIENGPPPLCDGLGATIVGTNGNDVINGTNGNDVIVAGDGNDTINGNDGNDTICGGNGNDTINAGTGADDVRGDPGADLINGDADNDLLLGNAGGGDTNDVGDTINGGAGDDTVDGWVGDDVLDGGIGNDVLFGMAGIDTVSYASAPAGVNASLTSNSGSGGAGNDTFVQVDNLAGSAFNDSLEGDGVNNVLFGRNGNDTLTGHLGDDTLSGDAGVDTGNYAAAPAAVTANLTTGVATGDGNDVLSNVENMIGSAFNDDLIGSAGNNLLRGTNGNDLLRGVAGNDTLDGGNNIDIVNGGTGNDVLLGRLGNDSYIGGGGVDTANFSGSAAAVSVNLTTGNANGEGADVLANVENVVGSAFNDILVGNPGDNTLRGRDGNDRLRGLDGTDRCDGGAGVDLAATCEVLIGIP